MNFRRIYNKLSRTYDHRHKCPTTRQIRKKEIPLVSEFATGMVLDIGCGTGFHLPLVEDVIGMDISEGMLERIRSDKPVLQASCEGLPFRDKSFDSVMCMFSVLNVCKHKETIREINRVLKPGGKVIISVASIWDWDHETLDDKKGTIWTEDMRIKRFDISGEDMEIYLFTKNELIGLFGKQDLVLEFFDSTLILQRPKWGDLTPFSLREKMRLKMERFYPKDYGCIYFMVFRKSC